MTQMEYIDWLEKTIDARGKQVDKALALAKDWHELYNDEKAKCEKLETLVALQKKTIALLEEKCSLLEGKGS